MRTRRSVIPGSLAWETVARNPKLRWENDLSRFFEAAFPVLHQPKFSISSKERFFCIVSCFARNVEEHLIYNGVQVLSKRICIPKHEWGSRPNGIANKFTTASIINEIKWLEQPPNVDTDFFVQGADGWLDLQLSPGAVPVSLDRAIDIT